MSTNSSPDQARGWPHGTTNRIDTWARETLGVELETWQLDLMRQFEAPQPRTMADLNEEELHAHVWKDVHVEGWDNPSMLVAVYKDEGAVLGHNWIQPWPFVEVRPLAELIPVEPTSEPVTEDTPEPELPRPEDVPAGEVWTIRTIRDGAWIGFRNNPSDMCPWTIVRTDRVRDEAYYMDEDITLVSRLVPDHPVTLSSVEDYEAAPVGTVIAYAGDVAVKHCTGRWYWSGRSSALWDEELAEMDLFTVVRWGK